jgi:hypothetical protein
MKELEDKNTSENLRKLNMQRDALTSSPIQKKQSQVKPSNVSESGAERSRKTTSDDLDSHIRGSAKDSRKLVQKKLTFNSQPPSEQGLPQFEVSSIPLTQVRNI